MNTRRPPTRRVDENDVHEEIPTQVEEVEQVPQDNQVPIVGGGNDVPVGPSEFTNSYIREVLLALARPLTTQGNFSIVPWMNVLERTMTSRLRDFVRMNPPIFFVSKMGVDPQEFLDGVYYVLSSMTFIYKEKAE